MPTKNFITLVIQPNLTESGSLTGGLNRSGENEKGHSVDFIVQVLSTRFNLISSFLSGHRQSTGNWINKVNQLDVLATNSSVEHFFELLSIAANLPFNWFDFGSISF